MRSLGQQYESSHMPVMLAEVLAAMEPRDGGVYVDGTFGAGGYSRALLESANCHVYAIDRDSTVQSFADPLLQEFPGRFALLLGNYADMDALLAECGVSTVDGVVLDLGVSSMQLDQAERGFSFRQDGPLDMRMGVHGMTAAEVVNSLKEEVLADIIYTYGEERASRRIAKAIVMARQEGPIATTRQLADVVRSALKSMSKHDIDPATRTFQALRIYVNGELDALERGLNAAESLLAPEGRLVVVSFHSLEDRIVKQFMRQRSGQQARGSRHLPEMVSSSGETFQLLASKAVKPTEAESARNPRARSARLRAAIKQGRSGV